MITVENLKKNYGFAKALRGISFQVQRGEVLGFLGPNGAGKSTTMKILTGFLLPTGGRASVDGLDVVEDSLEVRRKIGYLPESTPLYAEMRVDDYLRFAAEIRGVPGSRLRAAVGRVVDDSIVVLENTYRYIQKGDDTKTSALEGTREVAIAIFSSTLTTVAVFLPLGLFGGLIGSFFLPFGLGLL